jgi:hypothetical protein
MNYYVLVEGQVSEKRVYKSWIPQLWPHLSYVSHYSDFTNDCFTILSGMGYPYYLEMIEAAIEDILGSQTPTRLVICVDSEDLSRKEKFDEIKNHIQATGGDAIDFRIVVQHFCFETWALGNRKLGGPAKDPEIASLRKLFDVCKQDPEALPPNNERSLNRSQHAAFYLRKLLNNKHKNLSYSKNDPSVLMHPKYLQQIIARREQTPHIASFTDFLTAFQ